MIISTQFVLSILVFLIRENVCTELKACNYYKVSNNVKVTIKMSLVKIMEFNNTKVKI